MRGHRGANLRLHRIERLGKRRRWGRGVSGGRAWPGAASGPREKEQMTASTAPAGEAQALDDEAITRALVAESMAAAPDRPAPAIGSATFMDEPFAASADRALAIDAQTADAIEQRLIADSRSAAPDLAAARAAPPQLDLLAISGDAISGDAISGDAIDDRTLAELVFTPPLG